MTKLMGIPRAASTAPLSAYSRLLPGDILVQCKGEPWVGAAKLFCGHPFPHARIICAVYADLVLTLEETPTGVQMTRLSAFGEAYDLSYYRVFRPIAYDHTYACKALDWIRHRLGEPYAYGRLGVILIGSLTRLGYAVQYSDDDKTLDDKPHVCSELIARAYYRSGLDVCPHVESRDCMPWDFLTSPALVEVP